MHPPLEHQQVDAERAAELAEHLAQRRAVGVEGHAREHQAAQLLATARDIIVRGWRVGGPRLGEAHRHAYLARALGVAPRLVIGLAILRQRGEGWAFLGGRSGGLRGLAGRPARGLVGCLVGCLVGGLVGGSVGGLVWGIRQRWCGLDSRRGLRREQPRGCSAPRKCSVRRRRDERDHARDALDSAMGPQVDSDHGRAPTRGFAMGRWLGGRRRGGSGDG